MALNHGIQKYREAARNSGTTPARGKPARNTSDLVGAAVPKKKPRSAKVESETEEQEIEFSARKATLDSDDSADENFLDHAEENTSEGALKAKASGDDEDEELQADLEAELEREAPHTNALVKEDFSPVNSSRDKLILEYAPLIKYISQKIAARLPANIELDDLMSSGVIGLMDAIEKYDASRDNKFKTYAEFRIRGAILDELRAQDWVPRSVREKAKQLERCYARIEQAKGRQATEEEVCEELGISAEEFHDMLNQVKSVALLSYDDVSSFSKADKRALHGLGEGGSRAPTPFSEVNVASVKKIIADAITDLPEKQRLVLSLYYYEDLNLKEIGRVLDVTESRVSQLHTQAVLRLKARLKNHFDDFLALFG
jgi:RNA polymerase sigma factor for flagellar operon FliA